VFIAIIYRLPYVPTKHEVSLLRLICEHFSYFCYLIYISSSDMIQTYEAAMNVGDQ
jgi:hypothetical protein